MLLPLKVAILNFAIMHKDEAFDVEKIMAGLEKDYKGERQFNPKRITAYCADLAQANFIKKDSFDLQPDGTEYITYKITSYGLDRGQKFIPADRRK